MRQSIAELEKRWDDLALLLISAGHDPDDSWTLTRQRHLDLEWRDQMLVELRDMLSAAYQALKRTGRS